MKCGSSGKGIRKSLERKAQRKGKLQKMAQGWRDVEQGKAGGMQTRERRGQTKDGGTGVEGIEGGREATAEERKTISYMEVWASGLPSGSRSAVLFNMLGAPLIAPASNLSNSSHSH